MKKINCEKCKEQHSCCDFGAWVDLEEAKKILALGLKGDFYHLEKDDSYPSGYRVGTSYEDNRCSFLPRTGYAPSIRLIIVSSPPTVRRSRMKARPCLRL